ncbi:MAG: hypothetical protein ACLGIW_17330 [Gammaproteobacteria bacterium]
MGLIREEVEHDELPATIMVVERQDGETMEPWRFIGLECDHFERLTPLELRKLGHWLVKEGKRIGREYKSNGAPKVTPNVMYPAEPAG